MHSFEHSPVGTGAGRQPADEVDGLLQGYFRAAMPSAWPRFRFPERTAPHASGWSVFRSRFALAATVALLTFGSSLLAIVPPQAAESNVPGSFENPGAKGGYEQRIIEDEKAREMPRDKMISEDRIIIEADGTAAIKVTGQPPK